MAVIHVVPVEDLVDHHVPGGIDDVLAKHGNPSAGWLMVQSLAEDGDDDMDCACGPAAECVRSPNGDGWLIVHSALDGREFVERRAARAG